jgi:uncharacterized protein (TIGR02231 family)
MKKTIILFMYSFFCIAAFAGSEKNVGSRINNVVVYFDKAMVSRTADVTMNAGVTTLVFEGISPQVIDKTMQVRSTGNFIVIDVKHDIRYPEPVNGTPKEMPLSVKLKIEQLKDSVFIRNLELERAVQKRKNLEKEMDIIQKNKLFLGTGKSDTMPVLKDMMGFYRSKMDEIQGEIFKVKIVEYKAGKAVSAVQRKLTDLQNYKDKTELPVTDTDPVHRILVTVSAEQAAAGNLVLSYLVNDAGWEPGYDLRSENSKESLTLTYKAQVYQNTGEDWSSVKLKLSTFVSNVMQNTKPELLSWVLDYFKVKEENNWQLNMNTGMNSTMNIELPTEMITTIPQVIPPVTADDLDGFFNTVEFEVKLPASIPSDGKKVLMVIRSRIVPVSYSFYLAPKLSRNSFLVAKVPGWSELDLLPAVSSIYVNDTYMGETTISTAGIADTLDIGMGKDEEIVSSRKKIKDVEKRSVLGKTNLRTITIEMVVKNNKPHEVDVTVEDQVPVAGDKTIIVKLLEKNEAHYNESTGSLIWNVKLQPKQSKKITFTYTIEYDKDKKI